MSKQVRYLLGIVNQLVSSGTFAKSGCRFLHAGKEGLPVKWRGLKIVKASAIITIATSIVLENSEQLNEQRVRSEQSGHHLEV